MISGAAGRYPNCAGHACNAWNVYEWTHYTHNLLSGEFAIRTNIDIDDDLIKEAIAVTGAKTKKDVVTEALRLLVRTRQQAGIKKLRGKLKWEGSLDEMRTDV